MIVQRIEPAGAGRETRNLLGVCLAILLVAAAVILGQQSETTEHGLAAHQLDARRDLSAAEQGIYADLLVALDEIQYLQAEGGSLPAPQALALEGFPPFATDITSAQRGGHHWQLLSVAEDAVYVGTSRNPAVAGHFLLLPRAETSSGGSVWLNADAQIETPTDLHQHGLIAAGWKQLMREYDRGVTRHSP